MPDGGPDLHSWAFAAKGHSTSDCHEAGAYFNGDYAQGIELAQVHQDEFGVRDSGASGFGGKSMCDVCGSTAEEGGEGGDNKPGGESEGFDEGDTEVFGETNGEFKKYGYKSG